MRTARRCVAALLGVLVALVITAAPAAAHAAVLATQPAANVTLETPPGEVVVTFNERVHADGGDVRVHDATGERIKTGALHRDNGGRRLRVELPDLGDGGYAVTWRVVSADGHPVSGAVTWRVGRGGEAVNAGLLEELLSSEDSSVAVDAAGAISRGLLFAGIVLLLGGWAFAGGVWPDGAPRLRWLQWCGGAGIAIGSLAGLGAFAVDAAGLGLGDAFKPSVLGDVLDTDFGRGSIARLALLLPAAWVVVAARPRTMRWRAAAVAVGFGIVLSVTLTGHARTGRWTTLAVPLDIVHVGAVAVWLGGLAALVVVVLRRVDVDTYGITGRFSRIALATVTLIVATGSLQGLRQVDPIGNLVDTTYGRLLLAKILGVIGMVALAWLSRTILRSRPEDGIERLRQSVGAEAAIAVIVLAATSLLVAADPHARLDTASVFHATRVVDETVLEVIVAPARPGPVDIHLYIEAPGAGLTVQETATGRLSLPGRGITGMSVPFHPAGRSHFSALAVDLPIRGTWVLELSIAIGDRAPIAAKFTFEVE